MRSERHPGRLRRLGEELIEVGLPRPSDPEMFELLVEEVDHALRPTVHERRVPSTGTIVDPFADPGVWHTITELGIIREAATERSLPELRWFADGLSSWVLRRTLGGDELVMFDRPAGSERDLRVLSAAFGAVIVQRHPAGSVRIVGDFGVFRTQGFDWHHEPPIEGWVDMASSWGSVGEAEVLRALLEFAVHDLGGQGIGALLIYRSDEGDGPPAEDLLSPPPALDVRKPFHLAPLRHALMQVDGAAVFDREGVLSRLGVRVIPSSEAEVNVGALGGTRHTSGRRYSYDDPTAIVIAVSEDGPVTVLRNGKILARSPTEES